LFGRELSERPYNAPPLPAALVRHPSKLMRRHGKIQRLLLAILRQHERKRSTKQPTKGLDLNRLTRMVHRRRYPKMLKLITSREKESVRRALNALARENAVLDLGAPQGSQSHYWCINPAHLGRQSAVAP
jgi:hypothetical protein